MRATTEKLSALIVKPEQIPADIRLMKTWVVWRYEWTNLNWTKVPYQTDGLIKASSTESSTWGRFRDAIDRYRQGDFDGIGFILDPHNVIGVDLDHCVADSTAVWAMKIMFQLNSYTELSPSGTGLRILLYGKIPATDEKRTRSRFTRGHDI